MPVNMVLEKANTFYVKIQGSLFFYYGYSPPMITAYILLNIINDYKK